MCCRVAAHMCTCTVFDFAASEFPDTSLRQEQLYVWWTFVRFVMYHTVSLSSAISAQSRDNQSGGHQLLSSPQSLCAITTGDRWWRFRISHDCARISSAAEHAIEYRNIKLMWSYSKWSKMTTWSRKNQGWGQFRFLNSNSNAGHH